MTKLYKHVHFKLIDGTQFPGNLEFYSTDSCDEFRKAGIFYHDTTVAYDSPEFTLVGTTSTYSRLPFTSTNVIGSAYIVEDTNKVWVYTNSVNTDAVNGYVYRGMNYAPPEFTVTIGPRLDYKTVAAQYAIDALKMVTDLIPEDLAYDLDGNGAVELADVIAYQKIVAGLPIGFTPVSTSNYNDLMRPLQQIALNIEGGVSSNIKLQIVKKEFDSSNIWNDVVSSVETKSILDSTTAQAQFLQERHAELPDNYYYGGDNQIESENGTPLLTENDEPLLGP
jgi:hypothetical protein